MNVLTFNPRSLKNKISEFMLLLDDRSIDIAAVSESWLTAQSDATTGIMKSHGYTIFHDYRHHQRGGGTAIIYKGNICAAKSNIDFCPTSFEFTCANFKIDKVNKFAVLVIYRPGVLTSKFFHEFDLLLCEISTKFDKLLVTGDFNIHFENVLDRHTLDCSEIVSAYGLQPHVHQPTHNQGGTIDQVYTCGLGNVSVEVESVDTLGSDHYPIVTKLNLEVCKKSFKKVTYRSIKDMDKDAFSEDVIDTLDSFKVTDCFGQSVTTLTEVCTELLDRHTLMKTASIPTVAKAPWFDKEYQMLRAKRRKTEKKWRKSRLESDRLLYVSLRKECTGLSKSKKKIFFRNTIEKCENKTKKLYELVNRTLDRKQESGLPEFSKDVPDTAKLTTHFNKFFTEKVDLIRKGIQDRTNTDHDAVGASVFCPNEKDSPYCGTTLSEFRATNRQEIEDILKETTFKCAPDDMLPAELFKDNISSFTDTLVELVNLSLSTGNVEGVKHADVIPLLKNAKLDSNNLKNYRPVSNLTFLGKLIERVVLRRLNEHMIYNGMHVDEQSAYKKNNSTESLLVRITNDLLVASDSKTATVIMLLDLSAAFDTVDHNILLKILKDEIGLRKTALDWFASFLCGRTQCIRIGSTTSENIYIKFGVPQGSVLGPVLFNIYIRSIYAIVKKCGFTIFGYADDHQIFKSFRQQNQLEVLTTDLQTCFATIQAWMDEFYLQLNAGKTQIIVVAPPKTLREVKIQGVLLTNDVCLRFVSTVKNLGVLMDSQLNFREQIKDVKKRCLLTIRNIRKIRFLLDPTQLKMIVNSLVVSVLDYCNALYLGINEKDLKQLQLVQNAAAKCINHKHKHDHMDEDLKKLHWLDVRKRIVFKAVLLVHKSITGSSPNYLQELFSFQAYGHTPALTVPAVNSSYGRRALSYMGPKLWNNIPRELKECTNIVNFKGMLKTYLFNLSCYEMELLKN